MVFPPHKIAKAELGPKPHGESTMPPVKAIIGDWLESINRDYGVVPSQGDELRGRRETTVAIFQAATGRCDVPAV